MADTPLVSIIVTSYNYAQYIGQTIRSILDQTYRQIELIVVDDNSTDNSADVVRSFDDQRLTLIINNDNEGPYAAYNRGAAQARGSFIGTIDSDDWIAPGKIERQIACFKAHPDVDVMATFVTEVNPAGVPNPEPRRFQDWFNQALDFNQPENWLCENHFCHSSVLMRKSLRDRIGPHNPAIVTAADYEYWARCIIGGARFHMLEDALTYYRAHGDNVTLTRQHRGFVELAYVHGLLAPHLAQSGRLDLAEAGVERIRERCGGAGEILASLLILRLKRLDAPIARFEDFLKRYAFEFKRAQPAESEGTDL